jgi:hypothetical protein
MDSINPKVGAVTHVWLLDPPADPNIRPFGPMSTPEAENKVNYSLLES